MSEYTPQSQDSKCYVYLIQSGDGPVKIGVATDPQFRRNELQTGNPYPLTIRMLIECATSSGAYEVESAFHRAFADARLLGEWFDVSPEQVAEILVLAGAIKRNVVNVEPFALPASARTSYTKNMSAREIARAYIEANPDALNMSVRQFADEVGIGKTVAAEVMAEYREEAFSSNGNGH